MLEIESGYSCDVGLKNTYKASFEKNPDDLSVLHQYILAVIHGSRFVRPDGTADMVTIEELLDGLSVIVETDEAQPYECRFFYEISRALDRRDQIEAWLERRPEYGACCTLERSSYEILAHVGLLEASMRCMQDLVNTGLMDVDSATLCQSDFFLQHGDLAGAFEFLKADIRKEKFFSSREVMARLAEVGTILGKKDELLDFFRESVAKSGHIRWISLEYIRLCMELGLEEEAMGEYRRLEGVIRDFCSKERVGRENLPLFEYFCTVRGELGMSAQPKAVSREMGYTIDPVPLEHPEVREHVPRLTAEEVACWENEFKAGHKALVFRGNKMNKPFRTCFKLFDGDEKDIMYAKCIFANAISTIYNRFYRLFGTTTFSVFDYQVFREQFPFYGENEFTDNEIYGLTRLLCRIRDTSIQLNPVVGNRSLPAVEKLEALFAACTCVTLRQKTFQYQISSNGQMTVYGVVLFLSTFLNTREKESFVFELSGSDLRVMKMLMRQIFRSIPSVQVTTSESDQQWETGREQCKFSFCVRKELFSFLLEFERRLLKKFQLLSQERPNTNCKSFEKMVQLQYPEGSVVYDNLCRLHQMAISGWQLGEGPEGNLFTISGIVELLAQCRDADPEAEVFQLAIERMFIFCINRKYYNQLKWMHTSNKHEFLSNHENYCRKMLYRNQDLMTEQDEQLLYEQSRCHRFTYVNGEQRCEFQALFDTDEFSWNKITLVMCQMDCTKSRYTVNGEEQMMSYWMPESGDDIQVTGIGGYQFSGWDCVQVFDSPIATFYIKKAIYQGGC